MFEKAISTFLALFALYVIATSAYSMSLPEKEYSFTHTVVAGDTVWGIAEKHYPKRTRLSFNEFYCACGESVKVQNGGSVDLLPGQELVITYKDKL